MSSPSSSASGSAGAAGQDEHDALPVGTRLAEFELLKVLGVGGFGIVYLAMDHALDRLVAVKEYMPSTMAARGRGTEVSVRSAVHQDTFNIGLRSFVNEAKLLARFNHPSLVKVYRFWEANGTAYMAMPFYPGRTLKDTRRDMREVPGEAFLRGLVDPLLGAMETLHKESVYHRDIAPDNILLLPDGPPVLLDFGAARAVIGDRTQSLTAVLKPSYAPIEQYADVGHLRQGPWTDLYALGAVLHFVVTGRPPKPSASRAVHDDQPRLTTLGREVTGSMPLKVLKAIDWALTVSPHTRPQNVQQFREALEGRFEPPAPVDAAGPAGATVPAALASTPAPTAWDRTQASAPDVLVDLEPTVVTAPPAPSAGQHESADGTTVAVSPPGAAQGGSVTSPRPVPAPTFGVTTAASVPAAPAVGPVDDGFLAAGPGEAPVRPRASRAQPAGFDTAAAGDAGGSRTGLMLGLLAAVLLLVAGLAYLLFKDRLQRGAAPVPAVAAPAAPVPVIVAPAPATPSVATTVPPAPVDAAALSASATTAPAAVLPPPTVHVPDWSARPAPAASAASASAPVPAARVATAAAAPRAPARPRPAAAPAQPDPPAAPGPREVCQARSTGSLSTCLQRVCTQGALVDHAQCVQLRRDAEW